MNFRFPPLALAMALGVLGLAAYSNSFTAGFVIDSRAIILEDPRVRSTTLEGIRHIITEHYWWPNVTSDLYRPLTTLSFWFNYVVLGNGAQPFGYHVVNLLLHLANVLLLWRLWLRLPVEPFVAWLASALFAVHPVGVEAVTNLVGRADLLATLGVLGAALAWLRAEAASSPGRTWAWRTAAALAGILGVLAKENAIMAVAALPLLSLHRRGWRAGVGEFLRKGLVVVLPVFLAFVGTRVLMRARTPPIDEVVLINPLLDWSGPMTAVGVLGRYLVLLVWPAALSCDYSYPQIPEFGSSAAGTLQAGVSLIVMVAIALLTWRGRNRWPTVAFGLAWGAVMILPTSNLFVRIGSIMGERFLYLPLTGLALAGAAILAGAARWLEQRSGGRPLGLALVSVCIVLLAARTFVRNFDWKDERSIWQAAVRVCPRSFNVHMGLATSSVRDPLTETDLDAAIAHAEEARRLLDTPPLSIERENNTVWPELGKYYRSKAEFCAARGDIPAAVQWAEKSRVVLEKSIAVNRWTGEQVSRRYRERGNETAAQRRFGNPKIYDQLAITQLTLNRTNEAEATLLERRLIDPREAETMILLGVIARDRGAHELAIVRFLQAVLLAREHPRAWQELADAYTRMGVTPSPVTRRGQGGQIDAGTPLVRAHLEQALVQLVNSFRQAAFHPEAQAWQDRAIREFGSRPELFRE